MFTDLGAPRVRAVVVGGGFVGMNTAGGLMACGWRLGRLDWSMTVIEKPGKMYLVWN